MAASFASMRFCLRWGTPVERQRSFSTVNIMVFIPGKERTEAQWRSIYNDAGLEVVSLVPLNDNFGTSIVEGKKRT